MRPISQDSGYPVLVCARPFPKGQAYADSKGTQEGRARAIFGAGAHVATPTLLKGSGARKRFLLGSVRSGGRRRPIPLGSRKTSRSNQSPKFLETLLISLQRPFGPR